MADPAKTVDQNILPIQGLFNLDNTFNTFIGQGQPFFATVNPIQSGLTIANSTIDSTVIGGTTPSIGTFTNISTTTGTISGTPTNAADITNKQYVDQIAAGLTVKEPVFAATTTNITLSGLLTVDGVTLVSGNRVLVKNQTNTADNGIYIASSGAWSRSSDMSSYSQFPGAFCFVETGTTLADTGWVCTVDPGGTLGVTPITFVQFTGLSVYTAGTGLSLIANQFSITNTGVTANSYGSASQTLSATVNAQGQLTSLSAQSIAISASQITSGTIASSLISGSYTGITGVGTLAAGTWNASLISPTYGGTGASNLTGYIYGNGASAATASTTIPNTAISGLGTLSTQNANNVAITGGSITGTPISGSTVGGTTITASTQFSGAGTGLTGTAASLNIGGNAATVTNGVYTTGSYSNPAWITSILGSIVSGAVASATSATNVAGGTTGALHYQSGVGATSFLSLGTTNYVLTAGATAPQYVAQSTLSVGSASSATTATTATNLAGGLASQIPYQTGAGATSFIANGSSGQVLTSNGSSVPTWTTISAAVSVTDDTTTNATEYPLFGTTTSGSLSTVYTSSTKYKYNPSTGILNATGFSGSSLISTGTLSTGSSQTTSSTTGIAIGATASGQTNTINIGNAGLTGSTTTISIGSTAGGATTFNGLTSFIGTASYSNGINVTAGVTTIGGAASTAAITVGQSTASQTVGIASGAVASGNTKTINFGTGGLTGSTTNIVIGSAFGTTVNLNGILQLAGSAGTSGQVLTSSGTGTPTWSTASGATITDDTTTNATRYVTFAAASSGSLSTIYTSSTKLKYNPSTGAMTASSIIIAP